MSGSERAAAVRFPPPLVFLAALLLGALLQAFLVAVHFPIGGKVAAVLGALVAFSGLALGVAARGHFIRTGQHPSPFRPTPELILEGPYRFTRNPMYVGMTLVVLGMGLELDNVWMSALALAALLLVHVTAVLPEERYLRSKFGDDFVMYAGAVRRYM